MLLIETNFHRIFLLYSSNNHNFKINSERKKGKKRVKKQGKGEKASRLSHEGFFYPEGKVAEASWDGWLEIGQGTTCIRKANQQTKERQK